MTESAGKIFQKIENFRAGIKKKAPHEALFHSSGTGNAGYFKSSILRETALLP